MTRYANTAGPGQPILAWPYTYSQLRAANPNVSYPKNPNDEKLKEYGIYEIVDMPQPAYDEINENIVETEPVWNADVLEQQWSIVPATPEEIAARTQTAEDDAARDAIKLDGWVQTFIAMTPAEAQQYVEDNVTDLASAKLVIKRLTFMMSYLARQEYRE